ncbi:hypothetical protein PQ455_10630 [Sphingomonas naphthae]|uniref:LPXTG cell wall anchor domain-containing protein n=1 Tax=Sphingomonas naphthae TaxID=1813468 RepID=A0ABY7THB8_9SPHN|nr:hypothetical protein [Sphingomonas naphthae]WCT72102.1 hypothetical protein PQ455_10630 [Sphingomonas naphthae]
MIQATTAIGAFMSILVTTALWAAVQIAGVAAIGLLGLGGGVAWWRRR